MPTVCRLISNHPTPQTSIGTSGACCELCVAECQLNQAQLLEVQWGWVALHGTAPCMVFLAL